MYEILEDCFCFAAYNIVKIEFGLEVFANFTCNIQAGCIFAGY